MLDKFIFLCILGISSINSGIFVEKEKNYHQKQKESRRLSNNYRDPNNLNEKIYSELRKEVVMAYGYIYVNYFFDYDPNEDSKSASTFKCKELENGWSNRIKKSDLRIRKTPISLEQKSIDFSGITANKYFCESKPDKLLLRIQKQDAKKFKIYFCQYEFQIKEVENNKQTEESEMKIEKAQKREIEQVGKLQWKKTLTCDFLEKKIDEDESFNKIFTDSLKSKYEYKCDKSENQETSYFADLNSYIKLILKWACSEDVDIYEGNENIKAINYLKNLIQEKSEYTAKQNSCQNLKITDSSEKQMKVDLENIATIYKKTVLTTNMFWGLNEKPDDDKTNCNEDLFTKDKNNLIFSSNSDGNPKIH